MLLLLSLVVAAPVSTVGSAGTGTAVEDLSLTGRPPQQRGVDARRLPSCP
jgi:hypothetical protein